MEMDGEVGSAVGDMTLVGASVGDPVGREDGGPVGCSRLLYRYNPVLNR